MATDTPPRNRTDRPKSDLTWRFLLALVIADTVLWLSIPLWW